MKVSTKMKSDIWQKFPLVYELKDDVETAVDFFCACNRCYQVYQYKDASGKHFGTKNQIEHVKRCSGILPKSQLTLPQCMPQEVKLSAADHSTVKKRQLQYCIDGYHSFKSVEHEGLRKLMQTCVDMGAKYGKFDIADAVVGRKTVSREAGSAASAVKARLTERLKNSVQDGTVSLCLDMYTDDYRKQSYLDIHCVWVERDFSCHHAALAVRHFGSEAHTAQNIQTVISDILVEFGIPEEDTPVTTDHGSNVVAALKNSIRLDCMCHRLHTVLETAWRDTKNEVPEAASYETAVSDLCRFVKQSTGIQEQLPKSLKYGGDTRPRISMFRRADAVECSYEVLVSVLTNKNKLNLVAAVNRSINREIMELTRGIADVFESLEKISEPTVNLVGPAYYLLMRRFMSAARESPAMQTFKQNLRKYTDEKFWSSIVALHWMGTFLDPSFKQLEFIPQVNSADVRFKRNLQGDLDTWMMTELDAVTQKVEERSEQSEM